MTLNSQFDLLLAGAGHAHLGVLRLWRDGRRPPGRIGLLSEGPYAWYSGMLPGLLAGRYRQEQCRIALAALCASAGVEFLEGRLVGLYPASNTLELESGKRLSASWLSLNVGSQPLAPGSSEPSIELLPVKPFAAFVQRWSEWQKTPQSLAVLGGGAAGVELALALARQVPQLTLLSNDKLLSGQPAALRSRALRHLATAGVQVVEGVAVDAIRDDCLLADGQVAWRGGRVILATGASAFPWLRESGLSTDKRGFVRIGQTLQSISHPDIFAVGDCASLPATPHSGVYAVRQGPVLAANLHAALSNQALQTYQPQRQALALLADGEGGALLSWAGLTAEGKLLGWWKDRLDRGFMKLHGAEG